MSSWLLSLQIMYNITYHTHTHTLDHTLRTYENQTAHQLIWAYELQPDKTAHIKSIASTLMPLALRENVFVCTIMTYCKHCSKKWNSCQYTKSNSQLFNCQMRLNIKTVYINPLKPSGYFMFCPQMFWRQAASVHDIMAYMGSRDIAPVIPNLSTRWTWLFSFTPWPIYAQQHSAPYTMSTKASLIF